MYHLVRSQGGKVRRVRIPNPATYVFKINCISLYDCGLNIVRLDLHTNYKYYRLCNNINDFSVRVKMLYSKLHKRGYSKHILNRFFLKFCTRYTVDVKFGFSDGSSLWQHILKHSDSVSCRVNDYVSLNEIVKPCRIVLHDLSQS